MNSVQVHVGETLQTLNARVLKAVDRSKSGAFRSEYHVSFESWETLSRVLTPEKVRLLDRLAKQPDIDGVRLARDLGTDGRSVARDLDGLAQHGLIERGEYPNLFAATGTDSASLSL